MKKYHWLEVVETLSVVSAIGGSIVSLISQEFLFASIPLSLSVILNLVNRRRLLDTINHSNQTVISQLGQENIEAQAKLGMLTEQRTQVQQVTSNFSQAQDVNNVVVTQLKQENVETQTKLGILTEQLVEVEQLASNFSQAHTQLTQENVETQAQLETLTQQLAELQQLTTDFGQSQNTSNLVVTKLTQENVVTQTKLETFTQQLVEVEQLAFNFSQAHTQLTQENVETQAQLETLTQQLAELQQLTTDLSKDLRKDTSNLPISHVTQDNVEIQAKLVTLTKRLAEVQRLTTNLGKDTSNLQDYTQSLAKEQTKVANTVSWLREIEICSQNARINFNYAKSYYDRGTIYQHLGYKEAAIWDYTEAIRLDSSYAAAYQERGLTRAYLKDKKGAVEDLREAAKLFFEEGDIASYQIARDLSKKFYDLSLQLVNESSKEVAVEYLFA